MRSRMYTSRSLDYYGRERNVRIFRQVAGYFLLGCSKYGQCRIVSRMSIEDHVCKIELILVTPEGELIASSGRITTTRFGEPIDAVRPENVVGAFQDLLRNALPDETRLVLLHRVSVDTHKEYAKDCMI